ncbi:MAG: ATP-binding cassette domain-containing protein [Steroidobacteraceae bacterium]
MRFDLKVALRYLLSNRLQSALLIGGVAIAVTVFTFNAALINGLAEFQIQRVVGSSSHVTIEPAKPMPAVAPGREGAERLVVAQRALERRAQIKQWRTVEQVIDTLPGVTGVSLNIVGTGLVSRGQQTLPVTLKGVEPARLSAIAPIDDTLVEGEARLGLNDVLIGRKLASDLGIRVGQPIFIASDQGRERTLTVRGLYSTGVDSLDARLAYVNLDTARVMFDLPEGLTEIEIKLADIYAARARAPARRHHRPRSDRLDGQEPAPARGARGPGQLRQHHQDVHPHHDRGRRGERAAAHHVPAPARDRHHAQLRHLAALRAVGVHAAGRADRRARLDHRLRARLQLLPRAHPRDERPPARGRLAGPVRHRAAAGRRGEHPRRAVARARGLAHRPRGGDLAMNPPMLAVRDLRKVFVDKEFETPVLKGVSFALQRAEMVALLGPSGSGKSTLLSILGTLMRPTSGSFSMLGTELTALDETQLSEFRNQQIGFIFQYHHLLPDFTALENVLFPHAARVGRETRAGRERAAMLLERVGLRERLNYRATRLSGGQKQRVAIARALMNAPALVLADEPTGNLDRENADQVFELMTEMQRETGTTFLLSTHDRELAERCQRRIALAAGVVVDGAAAPASRAGVAAGPAGRPSLRVIQGDHVGVIDHTRMPLVHGAAEGIDEDERRA